MQDILLGVLDAKLDYSTLGSLILLYIVALWAAFSFWVFTDAKKRYHKTSVGIAWFLLVFVLNFPALIFYIIVRPETEEEFIHSESHHGGLNVPVANFIGNNDEVEFTLSIKLNPKSVNSESVRFVIEGHPSVEAVTNTNTKVELAKKENLLESSARPSLSNKLQSRVFKLRTKASSLIKDIKSYSDKVETLEEVKQNDNKENSSAKQAS